MDSLPPAERPPRPRHAAACALGPSGRTAGPATSPWPFGTCWRILFCQSWRG